MLRIETQVILRDAPPLGKDPAGCGRAGISAAGPGRSGRGPLQEDAGRVGDLRPSRGIIRPGGTRAARDGPRPVRGAGPAGRRVRRTRARAGPLRTLVGPDTMNTGAPGPAAQLGRPETRRGGGAAHGHVADVYDRRSRSRFPSPVPWGSSSSPTDSAARRRTPAASRSPGRTRPKPAPPVQTLRLAVTPHHYDDMGKLLMQLGSGFEYTDISLDDLQDVSKLAGYDVIFLTCGPVPEPGPRQGARSARAGRGPTGRRINPEILDRVQDALRTFVGRGGTLYASDWLLDLIRSSFPEFFDGEDIVPGAIQTLTADVSTRDSTTCWAKPSSSSSTRPAGSPRGSRPTRPPSISAASIRTHDGLAAHGPAAGQGPLRARHDHLHLVP